jgi:hypothetical protein
VRTSGASAADKLLDAMRSGIPDAERRNVIAQAREGVAMLHQEIARVLTGS